MSELVRGAGEHEPANSLLARARAASASWRTVPAAERLAVLRRFRRAVARDPLALARAVGDRRSLAETLSAELLPLLDAVRFLEREAPAVLARGYWAGAAALRGCSGSPPKSTASPMALS